MATATINVSGQKVVQVLLTANLTNLTLTDALDQQIVYLEFQQNGTGGFTVASTQIPQLVNLNSWPTTVFIGRDGLVKSIHAGFASPASGDFNGQLKAEVTARVEALLAQSEPAPQ